MVDCGDGRVVNHKGNVSFKRLKMQDDVSRSALSLEIVQIVMDDPLKIAGGRVQHEYKGKSVLGLVGHRWYG